MCVTTVMESLSLKPADELDQACGRDRGRGHGESGEGGGALKKPINTHKGTRTPVAF